MTYNGQIGSAAGDVPLLDASGNLSSVPVQDKGGTVYNVKAYGAVGDGSTVDTAAIDLAVTAAYNAGGGTVWMPPTANGYVIKRRVSTSQTNGGIRVRAGVDLRGDRTKLVLRDNCAFITNYNPTNQASPVIATVSADVALGDTNLTVTSSTGFVAGNDVYVQLNESSSTHADPGGYNAKYCRFAKVLSIPDGTHITLDRPILTTMSVAGTNSVCRQIVLLPEVYEGVIDGFECFNDMGNGGNAEEGVTLSYARNVRIGDIAGTDTGAGTVSFQYCSNIKVANVRLRRGTQQGGAASKGTVVAYSQCDNILIDDIYAENFQGQAINGEYWSSNIKFGSAHLLNNWSGRTNSSTPLIGVGLGDLEIEHLTIDGNGSQVYVSANFDTLYGFNAPCVFRVKDVSLRCSSANLAWGVGHMNDINGLLRIDTASLPSVAGIYRNVERYTRVIHIQPNNAGSTFTLPSGIYRSVKMYCNSATGITAIYGLAMGGSHNTNDSHAALVAGSLVDMSYPAQWNLDLVPSIFNTDGPAKGIAYSSDGTVVAGTVLVVEVDYWPITNTSGTVPVADDLTLGLVQGGDIWAPAIGQGVLVKEGSNAKQGTATLVAGTVIVANTSVTASSRIFLTTNTPGGTPGWLQVSARVAGTSFTILSSNALDTSVVAYEIFEPG